MKSLALLLAFGIAFAAAPEGRALAQDAAVSDDVAAEDVALLGEVELDNLVAPVALFPDALLTQVLVAATYPLDVVKASRWVGDNGDLAEDDRAAAADGEGWDPSIAVLAAGFPDLVERMAADLDHTEALGDAVLAQTDDVMDAVQRQRARAAELGNLTNNAAQTVTVEGDTITIAPAESDVIYVPAYDPALVYTQAAPSAPVVVTDPDDDSYSSGDLLMTGVIAFGAGMVVNEIFDDDDDWDDYWRGPPRIDWNDGNFYPRPGVNIDGDVNIGIDRGDIDIDRGPAFRPDRDRADAARDKIGQRPGNGGAATRPGRPQAGSRDAARDRLAARSGGGGGGAGEALRPRAPGGDRASGGGGGARAALAGSGGGREGRPSRPSRPAAGGGGKRPSPKLGGGNRGGGAMQKRGGDRAKAASNRGGRGGGGGGRGGGGRAGRR